MKVKVLYFSSIKDRLKKNSEEFDIPENTYIKEFIDILKEKHPEISNLLENTMIAVNEEYVHEDYLLKEGDVIAIIPPVSGG